MALVATSSLWLVRSWHRNPALYGRENLAERFRRQLQKLGLDVGRFLEGRSLGDLNPDEVYVLARILPGFGNEQRHDAYKGVVRDALAEGYVNAASSLEVLRRMRQELGISDDEHRQLLEELGVEDPTLLDPERRRSLEDQVRLSGYRRSLERLLRLQGQLGADAGVGAGGVGVGVGVGVGGGGGGDGDGGGGGGEAAVLAALGSEYSISPFEEVQTREKLSPSEGAARRAAMLLDRLEELTAAVQALHQPCLREQPNLIALLDDRLRHRQELVLRAILDCLPHLETIPAREPLLARLRALASPTLTNLLERQPWRDQLPVQLPAQLVEQLLSSAAGDADSCPPMPRQATLMHLERLAQDPDPTVATAAVVLTAALDPELGLAWAANLTQAGRPAWVLTTAERLQKLAAPVALAALPELEKRVVLATSDFFRRTWADTLDLLAERAEIRLYGAEALITEPGDTCRELLLLIEGAARVEDRSGDQLRVSQMQPGQVLDELEVLTQSASESTIVAETAGTRVLAVPVDSFDATLEQDPDFARRVLALETRQLQRITRKLPAMPAG
jgi:hypothetical protein